MASTTQEAGNSIQRLLIVLLALGLTAMLGTTLVKRLQNPALTEQREVATPTGAQEGMQMPQAQEGGDQVGMLMQQVAKNPKDMNALMQVAEALMHAGNWQAAETFAQRASVLDLNNPQPLFMLGVILHNLGREAEAAQAMEKVVALQDTARARYSLGVLYLYFLNQKDKGLDCLKEGLKDPDIDTEMKQAIEEELQKHK